VINETKNKKIIKDVEHLKLREEMELVLNEEGRYPCRAPGCSKTFAHSGRSRRNHEASHNPPVIIAKPNVPLLDAKPPPAE
jgi:transposase